MHSRKPLREDSNYTQASLSEVRFRPAKPPLVWDPGPERFQADHEDPGRHLLHCLSAATHSWVSQDETLRPPTEPAMVCALSFAL